MPRHTGLQHEWFFPHLNGFPNLGPWESCRKCGVIKARDPKKHGAETCKGQVKMGFR